MDDLDIYDDDYLLGGNVAATGNAAAAASVLSPTRPKDAPSAPITSPRAGPSAPALGSPTFSASDAYAGQKRPHEEVAGVAAADQRPAKVMATDDDVLAGYGDMKSMDQSLPAVSVPGIGAVAAVPIDPNATSAIQIDELSWWTTDKDIIQIATIATGDANCVKDVVFNEHKVNGKSRGSAWILFTSVEAAAKTKLQFDSIEIDGRSPLVQYASPTTNPFRIMTKESLRGHQSGRMMGGFQHHQQPPQQPHFAHQQPPQHQQPSFQAGRGGGGGAFGPAGAGAGGMGFRPSFGYGAGSASGPGPTTGGFGGSAGFRPQQGAYGMSPQQGPSFGMQHRGGFVAHQPQLQQQQQGPPYGMRPPHAGGMPRPGMAPGPLPHHGGGGFGARPAGGAGGFRPQGGFH
ncbi:hypothetical protein GGF31_006037 [Allomyces arbusculus]|nr:hypothetical protein GGF31_006037 [Allomyces arbusculus]